MAKVFLSFLGAGRYFPCIYTKESKVFEETKYIQRATLEMLDARSWTADDSICIFLTDKARSCHWQDLKGELDGMGLTAPIRDVSVPEGKNESEMWEIFLTIYNELQAGDELYIDLTHAFRYLPMLMLVLSNYAKFLKGVEIKNLSYGNWEAHEDVDGKSYAPITDLLPLTTLQDWTSAISEFLRHGYARDLESITKKILLPIIKGRKCPQAVYRAKDFPKDLRQFTDERLTCRGLDIAKGTKNDNLLKNIKQIADIKGADIRLAPLTPVFEEVKKSIGPSIDRVSNIIQAAQWCFDRGLYQQAGTMLEEGVKYYVLSLYDKIDDSQKLKDKLEVVTHALRYKKYNIPECNWTEASNEDKALVLKIIGNEKFDKEFLDNVSLLHDDRNDYNHAGFRDSALSPELLVGHIEKLLNFFYSRIIQKAEATPENIVAEDVFLNLSNHPSQDWDARQLEAASRYGRVVDRQFPDVDPDATDEDIRSLAVSVVDEIIGQYGKVHVTVHIMGEMTLTYHIVNLLRSYGITCVASCTNRDVEDKPDGTKLVRFHFAQFRRY